MSYELQSVYIVEISLQMNYSHSATLEFWSQKQNVLSALLLIAQDLVSAVALQTLLGKLFSIWNYDSNAMLISLSMWA